MKNQNIYQNLNKLVITTKKIVLLSFTIFSVTSSNPDSFSEHPLADFSSLSLNIPIQGQLTNLNAEPLIQIKKGKVEEGNSKKNEGLKEIQTGLSADEKLRTLKFPGFDSYVLARTNEELIIESTKKIHPFLRVYINLITNCYNNFYFKIIDENKFIIASSCLTTYDSSDSDSIDSNSYEDIIVDLKFFMKRATEHYLTHSKNEENYFKEEAVAAFCDKDSGEMIIKFLDSICKTACNYCDANGESIYYKEADIMFSASERIIKLIRESSENLDSQQQKISYPKCYKVCHEFMSGNNYEQSYYRQKSYIEY